MPQQPRKSAIINWLKTQYPKQDFDLKQLKGDASFRSYYRLSFKASNLDDLIVMDSPPTTEPLAPFIHSTKRLKDLNLPVPKIEKSNIELGCLVLEDYGNADLLSVLTADNANQYYQQAIDHLLVMQKSSSITELPRFDAEQIQREFELFEKWYLHKHLGLSHISLGKVFNYLSEACLQQPYVMAHRDYHSRNLMRLSDNSIGILDHQDLMQGPICYDLVSLIKDCYIDWPQANITDWIGYYLRESTIAPKTFYRWFQLTGVQRHLKAIGIFARLAYLYDNPNYLQYIPRTLNYIFQVADNEPNLIELSDLIQELA